MSQPNNNGFNPSFCFNVIGDPYDPQSNPINYPSTFSPWGPRAMENTQSPSPSSSTICQPTMSASNQGSFHNQGIGQPSNLQHNNSIDIIMQTSHLSVPPPIARTRSSLENTNTNFNLNDVYSPSGPYDEPWSSVRMRNPSISTNNRQINVQSIYGPYRERGPSSDIGSGPPHSDSGYLTHQAHSVRSNEPERVDQELPPSMNYAVNNLNVTMGGGSVASEPTEVVVMAPDQMSQYSGRSTHSKTRLVCLHCSETSKCPSDLKKHMLKHMKPHVCDVLNCRRALQGFTTKNDLDRHKKSVHRVGVEKDSYQCASEHCRNRGKIWPRLDNFKQHIARMHKDEDEQELVRQSAYQEIYPPREMPVSTLDTTLAGMGPEKHFGNKLDDPASAISLTPDQDSDDRHEYSNLGFNRDVDQTNPDTSNLGFSTSSSQHQYQESSKGPGKQRQNSLNVLAEAADRMTKSARQSLSSAPQTKAEQQQQALRKFSKAIVGEIHNASSDDVDLQDVVMRVLSGATNHAPRSSTSSDSSDSDMDIFMTKAEVLRASQTISSLIKQSSISQPHPTKATPTNGVQCQKCPVTLARSCDMKKHMKRHTKPYGCTFPNCYKRFGAKSDWKRHENSQHFQIEAYLCHRPRPSLTPATSAPESCNHLCYNEKVFERHLSQVHKFESDDHIKKEIEERRIGKNGQGQFWCGFCKEIVKLKETRNAAWNERFDHIDNHFSKLGQSIEKWVCMEAGRTKGELKEEVNRRKKFEEVEEGDVKGGESEENTPDPTPTYNDVGEEPSQSSHEAAPDSSMFFQDIMSAPKKRHVADDSMPAPLPKKSKRDGFNRYCCDCDGGPWPVHTYTNCVDCDHRMYDCPYCAVVETPHEFDDGMMMQ